MGVRGKEEHAKDRIGSKPYPCSKADMDQIVRHVLACVEAGLIEEYKEGDYPKHCSPCFLVANPGSTAKRPVVDYQKLSCKIKQHSGSLPLMENTVESSADCKFKTKMDKRSDFRQVNNSPSREGFIVISTLCVCCVPPAACCWCRVPAACF